MHEAFLLFTKRSSLRVYASHDELHIDMQKSEIFEGVDILISTPKMLNKLFLANGVHTSQIKSFSIDDAAFLSLESAYTAMMSITQSIQKCQYVIYTEHLHPKLKRFESYFMEYPKTVKV